MSEAQIYARSIVDCARSDSAREYARNVRELLRESESAGFACAVWHDAGSTVLTVYDGTGCASESMIDASRHFYTRLMSCSCAPIVGARLTRGAQ
jgi:hypothetical protein